MAPRAKSAAVKASAPSKPAKVAIRPATNGNTSKKRKADDTDVKPDVKAKKTKTVAAKRKTVSQEPPAKPTRVAKPVGPKKSAHVAIGKKINDAPKTVLDIYVFGEGSSGELGLGSKHVNGKKPIDVKRPRLNDKLSAATVGIVQIACGGMHAVALTRDNKILTWGVNDQGALGRDTTWSGGLRDADKEDDSDSDDDDDTGVNPQESTPAFVSDEHFAPGTKFVQAVASDSASFVLTEDGRVYGWGTFRASDGILGFTGEIHVQYRPMLLPSLKHIKSLAAGSNHILALDDKGYVVSWGCGEQFQLGRKIIERKPMSCLIPQGLGLPRGKVAKIACGSYHSFALDKDGNVWGWGLNNFGELGVDSNAGEDDAVILKPAKITHLEGHKITDIDGGEHHSLACSDKGKLITWGRVDGYQVGFEFDKLSEENTIYDERGNARILFKPTVIECKHLKTPFQSCHWLTRSSCHRRRYCRCRHRQQFRRYERRQGVLVGLLQQLPDRSGHYRRD